MKRYTLPTLFLILLTLYSQFTEAQNLSAGARVMPAVTYLFNGMPIARPPSGVVGDIYFNATFSPCTFTLFENEQVIDGFMARYNVYFDELDVKTQNGEKAIERSKVKMFVLKDSIATHTFVNGQNYNLDGAPIRGFLEVLTEGQVPLLKRNSVIVKEPDYHPALNTGSRDSKIIKETDLYYAVNNELTKVKNKTKLLAAFGDKSGQVEAWTKQNAIAFNNEKSLISIFRYYNSLLSQ